MDKVTQGKRVYSNFPENPGEYCKHIDSKGNPHWFVFPPAPGLCCGSISNHTVVEHDDGTITVSPSILFHKDNIHPAWHGYLEKGIWREC